MSQARRRQTWAGPRSRARGFPAGLRLGAGGRRAPGGPTGHAQALGGRPDGERRRGPDRHAPGGRTGDPGRGGPVTDELVLVVPTASVIAELGDGQAWLGIRAAGEADLAALIRREGTFRPRAEMEGNPAWKQVIPYPVLRDGDDWFLMRRTRAGSDPPLHH